MVVRQSERAIWSEQPSWLLRPHTVSMNRRERSGGAELPRGSDAYYPRCCTLSVQDPRDLDVNRPKPRQSSHMQQMRSKAGGWLRELREKRGLSQRERAAKVGADVCALLVDKSTAFEIC